MRKILTYCFFLFPFLAEGQSFSIHDSQTGTNVSGQTLNYWLAAGDTGQQFEHWKGFDVRNNASSQKEFQYVRTKSYAGNSFSFYNNCLICLTPPLDSTTVCPSVAAGDDCVLESHYFWDGTLGPSIIRYTIYDKNNPSDSVFVVLIYNGTTGPAGVDDKKGEAVFSAMMPNPADRFFSFRYSAKTKENLRFTITDICGKLVKEITPENAEGHETIDVSAIPSGIYFVNMIGDAAEMKTQRLVIAH